MKKGQHTRRDVIAALEETEGCMSRAATEVLGYAERQVLRKRMVSLGIRRTFTPDGTLVIEAKR